MSLAITMNLIAIVVTVGGWAAAVLALYQHLGDPYQRPAARQPDIVARQPDSAQEPDAVSCPRPVLTGRHAA